MAHKAYRDLSEGSFVRNRIRYMVVDEQPNGTWVDAVEPRLDNGKPAFSHHLVNINSEDALNGKFDHLEKIRFDFTRPEAYAIFVALTEEFFGTDASFTKVLVEALQREQKKNDELTAHLMNVNTRLLAADRERNAAG